MRIVKSLLYFSICLILLSGCAVRLGSDSWLKRENTQTLEEKIIRGQTTKEEVRNMFGHSGAENENYFKNNYYRQWIGREIEEKFGAPQDRPELGIYCYLYSEQRLPVHNFITSLVFINRSEHDWVLCIAYQDFIVQDFLYAYRKQSKYNIPATRGEGKRETITH